MTNTNRVILSKIVIKNSASKVMGDITTAYNEALQKFKAIESPTKSDKDLMTKYRTKKEYFELLVNSLANNDRALGALYYIMQNAKVNDSYAYLRELAENSYSLDKVAYLLKCLALKNFEYSASNTTGANVIVLVEMLKDDVKEFKPVDAKRVQDNLKIAVQKKPDLGYTQVNQLIKLAERIGLVKYKSGKRSLAFDATYTIEDNAVTQYLKSVITA